MPKAAQNRSRTLSDRVSLRGSKEKKKAKSIACQRCHSRKVKCSGEHPCSNCSTAGLSEECLYPSRDRQIKLSQQYVEDLLNENQRLREGSANAARASSEHQSGLIQSPVVLAENQEAEENPILESRPWFLPISSQDMPININEAADAAFATRFRQTLTASYTTHLPRESFIRDERLLLLSETHFSWPIPARARFLVQVALNTVCRYYHIVRKSEALESLETAIRRGGDGDRLVICKLLALFALGEAYSTKTGAQGTGFPGLAYFARARKMVSIPAERPQLDTIEIALLLVIYSYALNRRHAAYIFASSAVRLGIIMGMNMNVPEHQYRDRLAREHRTRLWWTSYIMDCTCASKLGLPVSISEEDIIVDLPSNDGLGTENLGDFGDTDYIVKSIELAKLSSQSISAIYSRRKHRGPFSQRVQASLKNLTKWMESLPVELHLKTNSETSSPPNHIVYLHLTFNQCAILATRPILLHVLRVHHQRKAHLEEISSSSLPDSALTLAETCIQCARHSYRLLTDAWIHGSFAIFDYFHTQHLFSAATILAISSLLGSAQSQSDGDSYNNAAELLQQLDQSGNFGAHEFCVHLHAMNESMESVRNTSSSSSNQEIPRQSISVSQGIENALSFTGPMMTAGMAFAEPSLQEFLAETNLDIQAFDNSPFDGLHTPYWPEIWGNGWGATGDS